MLPSGRGGLLRQVLGIGGNRLRLLVIAGIGDIPAAGKRAKAAEEPTQRGRGTATFAQLPQVADALALGPANAGEQGPMSVERLAQVGEQQLIELLAGALDRRSEQADVLAVDAAIDGECFAQGQLAAARVGQ